MTAKTIARIIADANTARGYAAFSCEVVNAAWVHIGDGATTALYRVRDIAEAGEDAMRAAFVERDGDAYSNWCGRVGAYHVEDAPKNVQRACRQLGLVTENW